MSFKKDIVKQKWEDANSTDFPLVCETCLGDNPYVRMTKEPYGKSCKICNNPFTVFAWQAGTKGRVKRVEICKTCAKTKNVCQVCIFDLQYGLPVQVRDKVLAQEGANTALTLTAMPQSDTNRAWFHAMNQRAIEAQSGQSSNNALALSQDMATLQATATLQSMARMEPRYQRNLPKLCSFYARGECNRGTDCPFRHEMPRDRNDPLSKQNTVDRFYGSSDPVAMKMMNAPRMKNNSQNITKPSAAYNQLRYGTRDGSNNNNNSNMNHPAEKESNDERAVATLYVRFEITNTDTHIPTPTEADLRDVFYSFGEIVSVRMHANIGAFIEYTTGEATELAILSMNRKWILQDQVRLVCNWARVPKRGSQIPVGDTNKTVENLNGALSQVGPPLPPPGGETIISKNTSDADNKIIPKFTTVSSSLLGVPRPEGNLLTVGGGPIKKSGFTLTQDAIHRLKSSSHPYPSSDPSRLGSYTS